jgi:hypothetical protein
VEQDLRIDPETGFPFSDRRSIDGRQNKNYTPHTDPQETARDYSRPHTIPAEEYEASTGRNHSEAVREWERNESDRVATERRAQYAGQ